MLITVQEDESDSGDGRRAAHSDGRPVQRWPWDVGGARVSGNAERPIWHFPGVLTAKCWLDHTSHQVPQKVKPCNYMNMQFLIFKVCFSYAWSLQCFVFDLADTRNIWFRMQSWGLQFSIAPQNSIVTQMFHLVSVMFINQDCLMAVLACFVVMLSCILFYKCSESDTTTTDSIPITHTDRRPGSQHRTRGQVSPSELCCYIKALHESVILW